MSLRMNGRNRLMEPGVETSPHHKNSRKSSTDIPDWRMIDRNVPDASSLCIGTMTVASL